MSSVLTPGLTIQQAFGTAESAFKSGTAISIACVIVGCVYGLLRARDPLMRPMWDEVDQNIAAKMLSIPRQGSFTLAEETRLKSSRAIMDVFYSIVDKDETLKIRRDRVYENGAKVTSIADGALIGILGFVSHLIFVIATGDQRYLYWMYVWAGVFLLCWMLLLPLALRRAHGDSSDA